MGRDKIRKPFRFKRFSVNHNRSSMPVGVDGVLIGAWAGSCDTTGEVLSPRRILDVGCGCGLIALMCAQRFEDALIDAIDIDDASVLEAFDNISMSIFCDRVSVTLDDVCDYAKRHAGMYDLIVSNPPYFAAGVLEPSTRRERARHQGTLSPVSLMNMSAVMLSDAGRLAMIV
ncbi:MAG: methyltransferase, partial [Muribaculaceae bacterium]|nr:methyltransferase [Muribaculaceae bacterium]